MTLKIVPSYRILVQLYQQYKVKTYVVSTAVISEKINSLFRSLKEFV